MSEPDPQFPDPGPTLDFPVVGIGASAGFERHLPKPVDVDSRIQTIREVRKPNLPRQASSPDARSPSRRSGD